MDPTVAAWRRFTSSAIVMHGRGELLGYIITSPIGTAFAVSIYDDVAPIAVHRAFSVHGTIDDTKSAMFPWPMPFERGIYLDDVAGAGLRDALFLFRKKPD